MSALDVTCVGSQRCGFVFSLRISEPVGQHRRSEQTQIPQSAVGSITMPEVGTRSGSNVRAWVRRQRFHNFHLYPLIFRLRNVTELSMLDLAPADPSIYIYWFRRRRPMSNLRSASKKPT